jgi:hypothetical protein
VKEEEPEIPLTPESYRPPLSSTPPLSSDEDDEVLLSTALPIQVKLVFGLAKFFVFVSGKP